MHIIRAIAVGVICCSTIYACDNPQNNASLNQNSVPSGWAANTQVNVYIDTTQFNSTQITGIEQAFTNWQDSAYSGHDTYAFIPLAGQPVPTGHYIVIRRETPTPNGVPDSNAAAYTSWNYSYNATDHLDYVGNSKMQINPATPQMDNPANGSCGVIPLLLKALANSLVVATTCRTPSAWLDVPDEARRNASSLTWLRMSCINAVLIVMDLSLATSIKPPAWSMCG